MCEADRHEHVSASDSGLALSIYSFLLEAALRGSAFWGDKTAITI